MIEQGIVEIDYENDIPIVNVERLESIELKLGVEALQELKAVLKGKKLSPRLKMKLNFKLLNIAWDRIVLTEDDQ